MTASKVQQFESVKLKSLDIVLLILEKRFYIDSTNAVNAITILGLHNMRFQNENLSTYGNEELETLLSYYGFAKKTQGSKDVPAVADAEKYRLN